jgi:hypothetical protein
MQMILDAITNLQTGPPPSSPGSRRRRATALLDRNAGSSYPAIPAQQGMCSKGAQIRMNWMPRSNIRIAIRSA